MNPKDVNNSGQNNYLYYVITDNEGKIRGNIIGAQHWVEEKDTELNPLILKAINRSARFILEQPPGSELLPKKHQYFNDTLGYIIEDLNLVTEPNSSVKDTPEIAKVQSKLEHIKEKILEIKDGYKEVENITKSLQSQRAKLKFLKEVEKVISQSWFEIKLVSFEGNINRIIEAKLKKEAKLERRHVEHLKEQKNHVRNGKSGRAKKASLNTQIQIHEERLLKKNGNKIRPLENFNLMEKIREANQKMQPRLKKEAKLEQHVEHLKEQRDDVRNGKSGRAKKASLNTQIQIHEEQLPKKNGLSIIDEQAHKAELHQAWVKGEEKKLSELVDKSFTIYEEPPEIDEVHSPRDRDMADKIVEVVRKAKEENTEATIMMGTAHLVYTVRTNVIEHLKNTFEKDLTGWSVKQVKINEN